MSLPPERITVKRRRDEDPVEALYIQQKKQRPGGFWRLIGDEDNVPRYAKSSTSPTTFEEPRTIPPSSHAPSIPTIRTTLQNEDAGHEPSIPKPLHNKHGDFQEAPLQAKCQSPVQTARATRHPRKIQSGVGSSSEPRRFHLARSALPISSPYVISKSSAQKYGNNRRNELAVFVEKAQPNYGAKKITDRSGDDQNKRSNAIKSDVTKVEVPQKRPNASAIERKWRAENWVKPEEANEVTGKSTKSAQNVDEPSNQWNYESNHLAEQLQQIALEEIKTGEKREQEPSSRHQQPKFKPKPPKPRQSRIERLVDASSEDESMTDSLNLDDDGDYVLDTYIRSAADLTDGPDQAETLIDLFSGTDRSNVGILVIDEGEEEAIWETFGENQESDPEWNSEEEDENAEDYYGNDYPEDEVDSDDEFGRGAYNYRHGASDDEEYGEGLASWSDEHHEA